MKHEILKNPMGMIEFVLDEGEQVTAEAAALVFMHGSIKTETRMRKSGLLKSLKAAVLGGESFFVNEFTSFQDGSTLGLTGNALGDIEMIPIDEEYIIQSGAFVCSTGELTLDTKWQGFTKGIFGSNLFMLKTMGAGNLFVNSFGGIIKKTLRQGEKMVIDNYQLVALSSSLDYKVVSHGGLKTTVFGGEALLVEVSGTGTVYLQTKNIMEFVRHLAPFLPKNRRGI